MSVTGASGAKPTRLTNDRADDFSSGWSRDGRWIYFASNRSGEYQVWKVPADRGEAVRVTRNGGFVAKESPDGQWVYYTKSAEDSGLWRVPRDGGGGDPSARIGRRGGLCPGKRKNLFHSEAGFCRPLLPQVFQLRKPKRFDPFPTIERPVGE